MTDKLLKGLSILLVDDERYSLQLFGSILSSMGEPEILFAENGAEALGFLNAEGRKVDIIISDFNMPTVHGLQLLKAVRVGVKNINRATPFAMLTGYSDKRLVDLALALDINAFLIKPASKEALGKRLTRLLAQSDSDLWLKGVENYAAIDVDEALNKIANLVSDQDRVRGFEVMPKDKALFRRPDAVVGVEARGMPNADGGDEEKVIGVEVRGLPEQVDRSMDDEADAQPAHDDVPDAPPSPRPQLEGRLMPIDELPVNSILARDVYTSDGRLFIHAGTELTPRILNILGDLHDLDHPVKDVWVAT